MLGTQVSQLGLFSKGEETSFDRAREKAPYKGRKLLSNDRNNPVKSGGNSASACSIQVNSGGDDGTGGEYYSSLSEEAPSEDGDCLSVMASNANNYHRQNLTDKKEADILSPLKARSNISKRNCQSNRILENHLKEKDAVKRANQVQIWTYKLKKKYFLSMINLILQITMKARKF